MTQANRKGNVSVNMIPSGSSQQSSSWFARHTKDVSDASLAEFEQLMAAMGYRHMQPTNGRASGQNGSTH